MADSAYGATAEFRLELHRIGLKYSVGVNPATTVFEVGQTVNRGHGIQLTELARKLERKGKFERCTWRMGTRGEL